MKCLKPCSCRIHPLIVVLIALAATLAGGAEAPRDDALISVEVTGEGPPLLLIPGLSNPGEVWDPVVARWSRSYRCHVVTLAGFGSGRAPEGPFLPRVRDELVSYMGDEMDQRPVVVGHSLGGFLSLWIAAEAPGAIAGAVAVDGVPFLPALQMPGATEEGVRPQAEAMRGKMAGMDSDAFQAQNRGALSAMITDPDELERVAALSAGSDPVTVARAMAELMTTDLRDDLQRATVPILLLAAGVSPLGSPEAVGQRYLAQLADAPDARVEVVPGTRHYVMLDDPRGFHELADAFLARRLQEAR